jgi:hypothetical protein
VEHEASRDRIPRGSGWAGDASTAFPAFHKYHGELNMKLAKLIGGLLLLLLIPMAMGLGPKTVEEKQVSQYTEKGTTVMAMDGDANNVSDISYVWQQVNGLNRSMVYVTGLVFQ